MRSQHNLVRDPIPQLVKTLAIPASIGFLFNTLFNVVDTWYAGLISTTAVASLSLAFPIFFIIIAIGAGIGTAATALIANALGSSDRSKAENLSVQAMLFGAMVSILVGIIGFIVSPKLFSILGASGVYRATAIAYMNTIFSGTVFFILSNVLNSPLTASGDTTTFRNTLMIGCFLNVVFDPWFIYGGFGLPPLGFNGIALATVVVQCISCMYLAFVIVRRGLLSRQCLNSIRPNMTIIKELAYHSLPASLNMLTIGAGIFIITYYISGFGKNAVAAYGIATRIEQIALLPTIGLNMATLAIVGQNFGASSYDRITPTIVTAIRYGFLLMLIGGAAIFIIASPLMALFSKDADVIRIGSQYLRIASLILWAYVILFVTTSALQGIKMPMYAIWIGLYRQIVAPALVFYVFAYLLGWGLTGIWWGIFLVTWSAALFTLFYTWSRLKRLSL